MTIRINIRRVLAGGLVLVFLASVIPSAAQSAQSRARQQAAKETEPYAGLSLGAFRLRSIGPALTSGRIADFAVNPENTKEYYVAVASGHVWKTVNAGVTWSPVFDN